MEDKLSPQQQTILDYLVDAEGIYKKYTEYLGIGNIDDIKNIIEIAKMVQLNDLN